MTFDNLTCRKHKPRLTALLQALRLDARYHRAAGDYVYCTRRGADQQILDLVGGYGSLILGHNHPELVDEARRFLASAAPTLVQGSDTQPAERLAELLSERTGGDYCTVFGSSGAEAVEIALKHALLETGGRTFVVLRNAFHGKTLGAVQLTDNPAYRSAFQFDAPATIRVRPNDIAQLTEAVETTGDLAGIVFEPVQGEGGVYPLDQPFVQAAAELCRSRGVPLIADECQTGCGRTGAFLASQRLGVEPDYVVLSKALGGGLAKISATLIRRDRYQPEFDLIHSSTFAGDGYSCAIAARVLQLLDDETLSRCRSKGELLLEGLRNVQQRFPDIVEEVRGAGLMAGVRFRALDCSQSFVFRFLTSQDALGHAVCSFLLNQQRIRAATTLSDPWTIRLQPSVLIPEAEISRTIEAFQQACTLLQSGDAVGLTSHLATDESEPIDHTAVTQPEWSFLARDAARFEKQHRAPAATRRVAWLFHGIDVRDMVAQESAFASLEEAELEQYLERLSVLSNPVVMSAVDVRSDTGGAVRLYPIMLPVTSRWMRRRLTGGQRSVCRQLIEKGIDVARHLGCSLVSLGQYTSIATRNGRSIGSDGIGLTTGNSYAIALTIQAIRRAMEQRGLNPSDAVLAIAGAAGNVGRTCAEILSGDFAKTILLGSDRPGSMNRLNTLAATLPNSHTSTEAGCLREANVVVAATSSVNHPLGPAHFCSRAIVCDVSVPTSVARDLASIRPDIEIIRGGIVKLPFGEDLEITGFPLPSGFTYGCMAEGILLGMEGIHDRTFTGPLSAAQVQRIENIATTHGFELADADTCRLGCERREAHVDTH